MFVFWLVAAILVVAALLFIVPPLLRKTPVEIDDNHDRLNIDVYKNQLAELDRDLENNVIDKAYYDRTYQEIERRLLQDVETGKAKRVVSVSAADRSIAMALLVAVPIAAIYFYNSWGEPAAVTGEVPVAAVDEAHPEMAAGEHTDTGAQVQAMVAKLAERMEQNPGDMEGWLMLARSYRFLQRHADAIDAFEKAMPMVQNNAQLLADYADTLAMATGGMLEGKPIRMIQRALELDPGNVQALWLAGTHHYEKGEYVDSLNYWRRLKRLVPPGSQDSDAMAANIAEVELRMKELGMDIPPADEIPVVEAPASSSPGVVSGQVSLQDGMLEQVSPEDTVFIYARAVDGPRMPLAIVRKTVGELPAEFVLDQSMSMMPGMSLADYSDVVVGARVSKSGNATPQSGDLEGMSDTVNVGTTDIKIVINTIVP